MRTIQYIPRATEKAYTEEAKHTYIFYIPMKASKQEIAKQIAEAFNVTVVDVRTAMRKGKPTRFSRGKHAYPGTTFRQDKKIAYITVKAGDKIPVFDEVKTEEPAKEDKKADKKAEKQAEKTTKKESKQTAKAEQKAVEADQKEEDK